MIEKLEEYKEAHKNKLITDEEYLDLVKTLSISADIDKTISDIDTKYKVNFVITNALKGIVSFI